MESKLAKAAKDNKKSYHKDIGIKIKMKKTVEAEDMLGVLTSPPLTKLPK